MSEPDHDYPIPVEMAYALIRIESKLNRVLDDHTLRLDSAEHIISDHESRLRAMEAAPVVRPANVYSAAAVIIPIIAILVALWAQGH